MKSAEHGDVGAYPDREHRDYRSRETWSYPKTLDREAYILLQHVGRFLYHENHLPEISHDRVLVLHFQIFTHTLDVKLAAMVDVRVQPKISSLFRASRRPSGKV